MADQFQRNFSFDPGSLGRNLATLDHKVDRAIDRVQEICVAEGEADLKIKAPWTDDTGSARSSLWAEGNKTSTGKRRITMGHGVDYGIYLEKSNDGRFQVIMPVLIDTARKFMRSMEHLFATLDSPVPISALVAPGGGARRGTSQTPVVRTTGGQFADQGKGYSRAAREAKAADKKRLARNASRRIAYAAKKTGTAITKRTRRG
jgi:hypothetical protein